MQIKETGTSLNIPIQAQTPQGFGSPGATADMEMEKGPYHTINHSTLLSGRLLGPAKAQTSVVSSLAASVHRCLEDVLWGDGEKCHREGSVQNGHRGNCLHTQPL